jgi:hypothetical protein
MHCTYYALYAGDDILTADVIIDSLPFFLHFSTEWVMAELRPLLALANNELVHAKWRHPYAPHDMGKYPVADSYDGGTQVRACGSAISPTLKQCADMCVHQYYQSNSKTVC